MPSHRLLALSFFFLLSLQGTVVAQVIRGRVLDDASDQGLEGAEVLLLDSAETVLRRTLTDAAGFFLFDVSGAGSYVLGVRHIAYVDRNTALLHVAESEEVSVELRLTSTAVTLEPLNVVSRRRSGTGPLAEFYERADRSKRLGVGRVFTREDLRKRGARRLSHMLQVVPGGRCRNVYLDGVFMGRVNVDDLATPDEVEGVEVYRGLSEMPAALHRPDIRCAVAVWTRRGRFNSAGDPLSFRRALVFGIGVGVLFVLPLMLQ